MKLRPITLDDLPLYVAIHCDPAMMSHLGGPLPEEGMAEKLKKDVRSVEDGSTWIFVIIPDDEAEGAAGTVVIWEHELNGQLINEIGWMVLPPHQGRGIGSRAVRAVLDRARSERRWGVVHAFPPNSNERSNAMCRRMGFTMIAEDEAGEWRGRKIRYNHWVLDLREPRG